MSKIIVLTSEDGEAITVASGEATPFQAIAMCAAASRFFQGLIIEAEVEKRLKEKADEVV